MRKRVALVLAFAVAIGILFTACSKAKPDSQIATEVKAQFFTDHDLKGRDILVSSQNGEVTLVGKVQSAEEKFHAIELAKQVSGVTRINDQLQIEPPPIVTAAAEPPKAVEEPKPVIRPRKARPPARVEPVEPAPAPVAAAPAASAPAPAPAEPPRPASQEFSINPGTILTVRLIDTIDTSRNRPGDIFHASLDAPLVSGDRVIVPKGAEVIGRLVQAKSAGRVSGRSEISLELTQIMVGGKAYPLQTAALEEQGASRGKRSAAVIGGGAGLGALIGAVAGGGKGAAIGAGVGAATGTVAQGATKGQQIRLSSETRLDFRLLEPLTITLPAER
jgi:hypothetical protein